MPATLDNPLTAEEVIHTALFCVERGYYNLCCDGGYDDGEIPEFVHENRYYGPEDVALAARDVRSLCCNDCVNWIREEILAPDILPG